LPKDASVALGALADRLPRGGEIPAMDLDDTLAAAERAIIAEDDPSHATLVLYRELVVAVSRLLTDGRRTSRA
jgi:hypothetical protein